MIDCAKCEKPIGSNEEPICLVPSDAKEFQDDTVCKTCFKDVVGRDPELNEQDVDTTTDDGF